MVLARSKAQLNQSARVGNLFSLPALISLKMPHGFFAGLVPSAGGFAAQIVFADQSFLNRLCSFGVNLLLASSADRLLLR